MAAATVGAALRAAARSIDRGDPTEARIVAELLLAEVLGLSRAALYARLGDALPAPDRATLAALLARYRAGEPAAYLTGRREFYGREFRVTPDVLIPRPETELLVDAAIALIHEREPAGRPVAVADIGTGSGAIAVSLAAECPRARIWAVDISPAALAVARENAARHGVAERIAFLAGDLIAPLPGPVDLIVANLPYVPDATAETVGWEPSLALDGGPDGLAVIARLLAEIGAAARHPAGILLEIGTGQGTAVRALAERQLGPVDVAVERDTAGHDRVVRIRYFS